MQTDLYYSERVSVFRPKMKESARTSTQTTDTENKEMEYVHCIKQLLNVNDKYVTLQVINNIEIPMFFTIKEIVDNGVIIEYMHITLCKRGDEYAIFTPSYDQTFIETKILNSKLYDILLFHEKNNIYYLIIENQKYHQSILRVSNNCIASMCKYFAYSLKHL